MLKGALNVCLTNFKLKVLNRKTDFCLPFKNSKFHLVMQYGLHLMQYGLHFSINNKKLRSNFVPV